MIRIEMLGTFRILADGREIPGLASKKAASLLAYLALNSELPVHRETLSELLWPESPSDAAKHNLRQALYSIRRDLNNEVPGADSIFDSDSTNIKIDRSQISTDVLEMEALVTRAANSDETVEKIQLLKQAAALYRGDLLPGIYDDWVASTREAIARKVAGALRNLVSALQDSGCAEQALGYAEQLCSIDPLDDAAHATLIRLFRLTRQPQRARAAYDAFSLRLQVDLHCEPSQDVHEALATSIPQTTPLLAAPNVKPNSSPISDRPTVRRTRTLVVYVAAVVVLLSLAWAAFYRFQPTQPARLEPVAMNGPEADLILAQLNKPAAEPLGRNPDRPRETLDLCRRLARVAWSAWYGPEEQVWIQRIQSASPSIRESLVWSSQHDSQACIELTGNLVRYWYLTHQEEESRRWSETALRLAGSVRTPARARVLIGSTLYLLTKNGAPVAVSRLKEALAILRTSGDSWGEAHALRHLGLALNASSQPVAAYNVYQQALARFKNLNDQRGEAMTLFCLCMLRDTPDRTKTLDELAVGWSHRAVQLFRKVGNDWGTGMTFHQLELRFYILRGAKRPVDLWKQSHLEWDKAMVREYADQIRWEEERGRPIDRLHTKRLKLAASIPDKTAVIAELEWHAFERPWDATPASPRATLMAACQHIIPKLAPDALPDDRVKNVNSKLEDAFRDNPALLAECRARGQKLTLTEAVSMAVQN